MIDFASFVSGLFGAFVTANSIYEEVTRVTVSISVSSCTASQNDDCPVSGVPTLSRRCVWDLALNN